MRFGLFSTLALALLLPVAASAQTFNEISAGVSGEAFSLSISPQHPAPYSTATVSTVSDSIDLNNAILTVSIAGKETYKGAVRPFPVGLGKTGGSTNLKVTISSGGAQSTQTLTIMPQDVALILEPLSSSPPLYPGKPSVPLEGSVRVVAVADLRNTAGTATNPASYSYAWTVDGVRIANSSGIGKSSIIVASPLQYRAREVSVTVTSGDGRLVGGASSSLDPVEPHVRLYENDPLLGIRYGHALSTSFKIDGAESTLYAAPFSLSTTGGAPLVQWFLNGSAAQTGNSITLRPTGSGQGTATVSLTASALGLTSAFASLPVVFGTKSTNLFGL